MTETEAPSSVLITDAYSATNIGDLELVRLTIDYAKMSDPSAKLICLAVDPPSFETILSDPVSSRLFSRLEFIQANALTKILILIKWMCWIILLSTIALLWPRTSKGLIKQLARIRILPSTAVTYASTNSVIAVGGGYLGDRYWKDSVLTIWTWWWASRIGAKVETMPISVEIHGYLLRKLVGLLGRRVLWRVRDTDSLHVIESCGIESEVFPDLAFSNQRSLVRERRGTAIALVGSDYLLPEEQSQLIRSVALLMEKSILPGPYRLITMHSKLGSTQVGGDADMSDRLRNLLASKGEQDVFLVPANSFGAVCAALEDVEFMVSARMHAGIAGLCSGVKVSLLAYEQKHFALLNDMGLEEYVIDIRSTARSFEALGKRLAVSDSSIFETAAKNYRARLIDAGLAEADHFRGSDA